MAITKIAQVDVGAGGAASIAFSSIPGTYTDLLILFSIRSAIASTSDQLELTINSDTTNGNYSGKTMYGNGSTVPNQSVTFRNVGFINGANATASTFGNGSLYIPNYSVITSKSLSLDFVTENNATAVADGISAVSWSGTTAVAALTLKSANIENFVQYSSATLYGISKSGATGATVA